MDKNKTLEKLIFTFLPVPRNYLIHFFAASTGYFILALVWLGGQGVSLIKALPVTVAGYVILTAALRFILEDLEQHVSKKTEKKLESSSLKEVTEKDQDILRHKARILGLQRDSRRMQDRVLGLGAQIAIGLVLYWFIFKLAFNKSAQEVFLVPWYLLIPIWLLQIVWLPPWLVYCSFFTAAGLRFAFEIFGPTIMYLLPNFLMLPFFYFFMMIFMFGSIMLPNLMQIKFHKPGDATWETPEGTMRGQPEARAITEVELRKFIAHAEGRGDRPASRGIIFEGPPGTGKTLYAKEIGTRLELPFVYADAQALNPPFFGFAQFVVLYLRWRVENLAKEYGGAIIFVDEAENLLAIRSGMSFPSPGSTRSLKVWDMFEYDKIGCISPCGLLYDSAETREIFWPLKTEKTRYEHPVIFFGGWGGPSAAIFSFLTWLDGVDSPPLISKIWRSKVNELLDALFVPVTFRGKILRLSPAKPPKYNLLFLAATNRAWMLDPAIRRPGRFGVTARFKTPDVRARAEVAELYLKKAVQKNWVHPELLSPEKIQELARATPGMSPAEIEAMINLSPDVRLHHIENLKRIKEMLDSGIKFEELLEEDRIFWMKYKDELNKPGWDDPRADWRSLMEARSQVLYGKADPGRVTSENKRRTAFHETAHLIALKAFLGNQMKPTVFSIMPRGQALGMVAHVPVEERDPKPQSFYEGLLRVSLASVVGERFFFNENEPGVSSDLENATRIACYMVGKAAMVPYRCSPLHRKKYASIGETLISVSDEPIGLTPWARTFVERVLSDPRARERVAVLLGQAIVDVYRVIKANEDLFYDIVNRLLELEEISGKELEELWESLDKKLIPLNALSKRYRSIWPERLFFGQENPFYYAVSPKPEAKRGGS